MRDIKLTMVPDSKNEEYRSAVGHVMQRENGLTPNGNKVGGRWVLRDKNGKWIDFDQYRNDLAERNGFQIESTPF